MIDRAADGSPSQPSVPEARYRPLPLPELVKGPKLHEQIAAQLADWIVESRFAPGQALPPEVELAARFGVSRATVREAAKTLVARGLITVRHGVGLEVNGASTRPVADALALLLRRERAGLVDLLETRRLLEVEIAGLAAERATAEDLRALERALSRLGRASDPLSDQVAADAAFHEMLARAAHNTVMVAISEAIHEPLLRSMETTYPVDGGPARRVREHEAMYRAVAARSPEAAREATRALLATTEAALGAAGLL
ncbi:MAG: FadR family transcriptional regulator [Chloroflexi bacterium]|nr:FadR family transcriptional regulator [Chloroflexota bacterium]